MTSRILHIVLFLALASIGYAQENSIQVIARPIASKIHIKWAPGNSLIWTYSNQYGYTMERITVMENGKPLSQPVKKIIGSFKPAVLPDWEEYQNDDYVAVTAQAIYGEKFETNSTSISGLMNAAREVENRYSFALYACDQSTQAAMLAGLYFEDEEVGQDHKYLYRIYSNTPLTILKIDTAVIFIGLGDYYPLPPPPDISVEFRDRLAVISWNSSLYSDSFSSFWIERSDDGKTFKRITETPYIPISNETYGSSQLSFKLDSLESNNKKYWYRVVGLSPFGELSEPSDTISGMSLPSMDIVPRVTGHELRREGVRVFWSLSDRSLVKSVSLLREHQSPRWVEVISEGIDSASEFADDVSPYSSNYYIVRVVDTFGRSSDSFPYLVMLEDSIPPNVPTGLQGSIDTAGNVFLKWNANSEPDLYAYQVFRSNFQDEGYLALPGGKVTESQFRDKITLKSLSEAIHYQIRAIDHRNNFSKFSETLTLAKPDLVPPLPPQLTGIESNSAGIIIRWEFSASADVAQHLVYRRADNEPDWTLIQIISEDERMAFFYDKDVTYGRQYFYTMLAVDDDGLESSPAAPTSITCTIASQGINVPELHFIISNKERREVRVSWNYQQPASLVDHFEIFRSVGDQPFQLFSTTPGGVREVNDVLPASTAMVRYQVGATLVSGLKSPLSKPLTIKF